MIKKIFLLSALLVMGLKVYAENALHPQWLNMLYYEKKGKGYESLVDSPEFFIHQRGKTSPKLEYEANFERVKKQDKDFQKRFPLRYHFLAKVHDLKIKNEVQQNQKTFESVILAYPNQHLSSPTSMFGHLFLILKSQKGYLDSSIYHYLAEPEGANLLTFIPKGLTGYYQGQFLKEDYYKRIKFYHHLEDRRIDYYEIKLNHEAQQRLIWHIKELENISFDYYFFDENCAYFLARFLNVILNDNISNRNFFVFPAQVVNRLNQKHYLTSSMERVPQNQRFLRSYRRLNKKQKQVLMTLLQHKQDSITKDKDVLKAFIFISEYMVSNHPAQARTIWHNRIHAFQALNKMGEYKFRSPLISKPKIQKIKTKAVSIQQYTKQRQNTTLISFHPLHFIKNQDDKNIAFHQIDLLKTTVILNSKQVEGFAIKAIDIQNFQEYNRFTKLMSWRIKNQVNIKDKWQHWHSLERGWARTWQEKTLGFFLLGAAFGNQPEINMNGSRPFRFYKQFSLGLKHEWTQFKLMTSFEWQCIGKDFHYWINTQKHDESFLFKIGWQSSHNQNQILVDLKYLF